MKNKFNASFNSLNGLHKDIHFCSEKERIFIAFYKAPKTVQMVANETGISENTIYDYLVEWTKSKTVQNLNTGNCPISKNREGYFTTDPNMFHAIFEPSNTERL